MRGDHFLRQKRYETALPYYREITVRQPDNAFAFYKIGYCFAALNRYQDAIAAYDRALQIRPDYYAAHANLSRALEKLGQMRAASEYMERALRNDPLRNNPKRAAVWHHRLGLIQSNQGDLGERSRTPPHGGRRKARRNHILQSRNCPLAHRRQDGMSGCVCESHNSRSE